MHITWQNGLLLRIQNYRFEDDGSTRDKYTIVLAVNEQDAYVIHSLTTSQNKLNFPAQHAGCQVYKNMPYYFFPAGDLVGDQDFYFDKDTFIFFSNNVRKEPLAKLQAAAKKSAFALVPLGQLSAAEIANLLDCILQSNQVPKILKDELHMVRARL